MWNVIVPYVMPLFMVVIITTSLIKLRKEYKYKDRKGKKSILLKLVLSLAFTYLFIMLIINLFMNYE